MTLDTCWWQLHPEMQEKFEKQTGSFREMVDTGLMVQMGHDGVSSLSRAVLLLGGITPKQRWLQRSCSLCVLPETWEHLKAGSLLSAPQGLLETEGLTEDIADPQIVSLAPRPLGMSRGTATGPNISYLICQSHGLPCPSRSFVW